MRDLLLCLALAVGSAAIAQPVADDTRARNIERALETATQDAGDPERSRASVDAFLAKLPKSEALRTELDLVELAVEAGHLQRESSRFAREHLKIVEKYMLPSDPDRDPLFEYWSYRVMIEAKHERKEIAAEEREYLLGRKQTELRRALDANVASRERAQEEAQQRLNAARQLERRLAAQEEAEARAIELERTRLMLEGFNHGIQRSLGRGPVVCTRMGVNTVCR